MKLAFVLFKYFPHGGLQRDCMKIAHECVHRDHQIDFFCLEWVGPRPQNMNIHLVPVKALRNYRRYELFSEQVQQRIAHGQYDGVVGFNRMAGLDVYFAADTCFALKCEQKPLWYRYIPRSQSFLRSEKEVYGQDSTTELLFLSDHEISQIERLYGTAPQRFHLLPPGVSRDRLAPDNYQQQRDEFRTILGLRDDQKLLLMVGSGFRTKGVDRAITALANLPEKMRKRAVLMILGQDNSHRFERQARRLGVYSQVQFLGGRDDASHFFFAADALIHPAYRETAGMVLLEAVAAQLPVLVTDTCGYSFHIQRSGAGIVHQSPFDMKRFTSELIRMLETEPSDWKRAAREYVLSTDIFGLALEAVDVIEQVVQ